MNENLNEIIKRICDSLTDEQMEKAKACKTIDELIKLAGEEGVELPDEVLDAVSGGYEDIHVEVVPCPICGVRPIPVPYPGDWIVHCTSCNLRLYFHNGIVIRTAPWGQ